MNTHLDLGGMWDLPLDLLVLELCLALTGDAPGGRGLAMFGAVHVPSLIRNLLLLRGPIFGERLEFVLQASKIDVNIF